MGVETNQIIDHGRYQYEQVASDMMGIGLGMMCLGALDKLMKIPKRPWQKEKLDFSFLRLKLPHDREDRL